MKPASPPPGFQRLTGGSILAVFTLAAVLGLGACDRLMTTAPPRGDVFDAPLAGLSAAELAAFVEGDDQFALAFAPATGLGPVFNNVSCASCHSGDGRGRPENALTRFSRGGDLIRELGGPQLQERAIPGAEAETLPPGVETSLRLPPPVFGVGLIEAIPEADILANADETDADGDGVSGRPNFVIAPDFLPAHAAPGTPLLGRFSRKAQVSSILQQTIEAYHQDIGITTDFITDDNFNPLASGATLAADRVPDPELATSAVHAVVAYMRMLAPPEPGRMTTRRIRGRDLFGQARCASCHVPAFQTGTSSIPALRGRTAQLYSDLLLHDMGPGLADGRPDGQANGSEWRTTPLWGLRIMSEFLNGQVFLMHDGRARSVEQAIRLHGGEADSARIAFEALPPADRAALIDFVESR